MDLTLVFVVTFLSPIVVFGSNWVTHRFKKRLAWLRLRDDPRLFEGVNLTRLLDAGGGVLMKKCQIVEMQPGRVEVQSLNSSNQEILPLTVLEFEKMHPFVEPGQSGRRD